MIRGGDTPKQETLWAIEFESGKFAFGHANENQIFVATSGIGREIWYADNNGFIAGSTESVDEVTGTIIDTYNEHFGTRISHLTPEAKTFKVGDIIKNWNAYEKIETTIYIKAKYSQSAFTFGFLSNDGVFHWQMFSESLAKLANAEGVVQSNYIQQAQGYWENRLKAKLQTRWDVKSYVVEVDATLNPGTTVPNWQNYEIVE